MVRLRNRCERRSLPGKGDLQPVRNRDEASVLKLRTDGSLDHGVETEIDAVEKEENGSQEDCEGKERRSCAAVLSSKMMIDDPRSSLYRKLSVKLCGPSKNEH